MQAGGMGWQGAWMTVWSLGMLQRCLSCCETSDTSDIWTVGCGVGAFEAPATLTGYDRAGEPKICVWRWLQLHFQEHIWLLVEMFSAAQVHRWGKTLIPSVECEFLPLECCSDTRGILWHLSGDVLAPPLLSPILVQSSLRQAGNPCNQQEIPVASGCQTPRTGGCNCAWPICAQTTPISALAKVL